MADELPEGVKARLSTMATQRDAAKAEAATAAAELAAAKVQLATAGAKMEGFVELTQANVALTAEVSAGKAKYEQLGGLVSAGLVDQEARDLAIYYHGKAGEGAGTLVEWAGKLTPETAPTGLRPFLTPAPAPATTTTAPPPSSAGGTTPQPPPPGEKSAADIQAMSLEQFKIFKANGYK